MRTLLHLVESSLVGAPKPPTHSECCGCGEWMDKACDETVLNGYFAPGFCDAKRLEELMPSHTWVQDQRQRISIYKMFDAMVSGLNFVCLFNSETVSKG
jgi:hypothetical protein